LKNLTEGIFMTYFGLTWSSPLTFWPQSWSWTSCANLYQNQFVFKILCSHVW